MARADMESASPERQSIQAASIALPEELSASSGAGATLGAMMGDQSLSKRRGGVAQCRLVHGGPRGPFPVRGRGTRWASRVHECGGGSRVRVHAGRAKAVRCIFLFRRPDCPIADTPSQMKASWRNDAVQKRGESIQSFHRTCAKSRAGRCN